MKKIFDIYFAELRYCLGDIGILVFFMLVPLGYPLLYTYIYSNEVVRDIKVAACDLSDSSESRRFLRNVDATPEVTIEASCTDTQSARELMREEKVKGIIYIPEDFDECLMLGKQAHVSIYCSMASLFYYKSMLAACTDVSLATNKRIQIARMGGVTRHEAEIQTTPMQFEAIGIANSTVGFANFIIPAIVILILQQTLLLGIGMRMGTEYEKGIRATEGYGNVAAQIVARSGAYFTVYIPVTAYILCVVPAIFGLSQLSQPLTLALFMLPYLLACIFFAMTLGYFVHSRETPLLLFVFTSVPFLFLSGISWPGSSIPLFWKLASYLLPSTPGINGFVSINETGATISNVLFEYHLLWIQTFFYCLTACILFRKRIQQVGRMQHRHSHITIEYNNHQIN